MSQKRYGCLVGGYDDPRVCRALTALNYVANTG